MTYKISYNSKWNEEGTQYDQTINVKLSREEFRKLNYIIATAKLNYKLLHLDTFKKGINYANLTQSKFFAEYFNIVNKDKRYKDNRNTIVIIDIVK